MVSCKKDLNILLDIFCFIPVSCIIMQRSKPQDENVFILQADLGRLFLCLEETRFWFILKVEESMTFVLCARVAQGFNILTVYSLNLIEYWDERVCTKGKVRHSSSLKNIKVWGWMGDIPMWCVLFYREEKFFF